MVLIPLRFFIFFWKRHTKPARSLYLRDALTWDEAMNDISKGHVKIKRQKRNDRVKQEKGNSSELGQLERCKANLKANLKTTKERLVAMRRRRTEDEESCPIGTTQTTQVISKPQSADVDDGS